MPERPEPPTPDPPPGPRPSLPPPPSASPIAVPPASTPIAALGPTAAREREPILDVLRGFALMGILLVNIEFMRGPEIYGALFGFAPGVADPPVDRATSFLVGWLVSGKFVSAFSIMFGIGAALLSARALAAGGSPAGLLARRYGWLIAFGLAHMLLLFPGDVLFVYGITGMVLLAFVQFPVRILWRWSVGLLVATTVVFALLALVAGSPVAMDTGAGDPFANLALDQQQRAAEVYAGGSYRQLVGVNATLSLLIQSGQLLLLPWFLALFIFGFALGRSGLVHDVRSRRTLLRRAALVGLGVGLPINLFMGLLGPLGAGQASVPTWVQVAGGAVQLGGAPILTIGYLASLTLLCLRVGPIAPLAATGRMALSAYLLQSLLALLVFWGLGFYDRLGATEALVVVAGIWAVVVTVSMLWMRSFRFGPAEWVWRTLTYGRRQPLRR